MGEKPTYKELELRVKELEKEAFEHKRAAEAIKESEERFRLLFERSNDVIIVHQVGKIKDVNRKACELTGYTREQLLTMSALDLFPEEYQAYIKERLKSNVHAGATVFETRWKRADGRLIDVEVSSNVFDPKERTRVGITRDITERKRAEEALKESEERFRNLYDEAPVGYMEFDAEGRITNVNKKQLETFGYIYEEMVGQFLWNFVLEREEARKTIKAKLSGDIPPGKGLERNFIRKDGTTFPVLIDDFLVKDKDGRIKGIRAINRDITDLKQAEEDKKRLEAQLRQSQKMESIGTIAGGIAHNFNNILGIIMANAELMLMDFSSNHPNLNNLQAIKQEVHRGSRLTSQLLGYARIGKYETKPISLNNLVIQTSKTFSETRKEIVVHSEFADNLFGIKADQGQIEQMLLNLYINAADAMPNGGDLFLKTVNVIHDDIKGRQYDPKPGNYVLFTVRDTGAGMDKETMKRIFDPFFTTDVHPCIIS